MAKPKGSRGGASPRKKTSKSKSARAPQTGRKVRATKKNSAVSRRSEPVLEPRTKTEACLALLVRAEGASIEDLQQLTGWQAHSVRGFLSGTVKKIPGASLTSEKGDGTRRYFLRRVSAPQKNRE